MAKFNTVEEVKKEFLLRSRGGDKVALHQTRYSDIDNFAPIVERLLDTDYNKVYGYGFSEIMEAVSLISENYGSDSYLREIQNDSRAMKVDESLIKGTSGDYNYWSINEELNTATTAQAPYPVPSLALTLYQYEKAVIPYLCHQFDLKGNRGLVYYQRITSESTKGNVKKGDLLGSPKEMGKQLKGFIGTRTIDKEELVALGHGTEYGTEEGNEIFLANHPVQAGSTIIYIPGQSGYFKDFVQEGNPDTVSLVSVGGNLGYATLTYSTGKVEIHLAEAPTASIGQMITARYNADVETIDGGAKNMPRVQVSLDSKQLEAEDFSVFTETSIYQEALAKAIFGQDWNSQVDEALAALYNKEVANKIVSEIEAEIPLESQASRSLNHVDGGNNDLFNVQFVAVIIGMLGKMITKASGIGNNKLSAFVINVDLLPVFKALPKFTAANADFEEVMGGMYLAGLYDGMPVLVGFPIEDAAGNVIAMGTGEIVGIYKSKNKDFLTPYVWGTFILPIIRDIYDQENLAVNRKQLISSAAGRVVAERLAATMTITELDAVLGKTKADA